MSPIVFPERLYWRGKTQSESGWRPSADWEPAFWTVHKAKKGEKTDHLHSCLLPDFGCNVTSRLTFLSSQPCWLPSNCEPNKPFLMTARMDPRYLTLLKRCSSSCRQLAHISIWIVSLRERRTVFDLRTSKHCQWTGTSRLWPLFQGVENRSTEIWKGSKRQ